MLFRRKKKNDPNFAPATFQWRVLILAFQTLVLFLRFEVIALLIVLHTLPLSPYVRILDETLTESCVYIGGRGLWHPGWTTHCPEIVLRRHFNG